MLFIFMFPEIQKIKKKRYFAIEGGCGEDVNLFQQKEDCPALGTKSKGQSKLCGSEVKQNCSQSLTMLQ